MEHAPNTALGKPSTGYGWMQPARTETRGPGLGPRELRIAAALGTARGRLLIAGCGRLTRGEVQLAREFAGLDCLDSAEAALREAAALLPPGARPMRGSALFPPYELGRFDAVLCRQPQPFADQILQERLIEQLLRVLKPGGRLVLTTEEAGSGPPVRWERIHRRGRVRVLHQPPSAGAGPGRVLRDVTDWCASRLTGAPAPAARPPVILVERV